MTATFYQPTTLIDDEPDEMGDAYLLEMESRRDDELVPFAEVFGD
ncbi:hypothetical protein AGMMS49959_08230 [Planctomycetales bacterium]|nr:hypothetical protein AGMMS49959_08230 [Planctomycetales bacterium]